MLLAMLAAFTPHLLDARLYGLPAMLNVNKHTDHKQGTQRGAKSEGPTHAASFTFFSASSISLKPGRMPEDRF